MSTIGNTMNSFLLQSLSLILMNLLNINLKNMKTNLLVKFMILGIITLSSFSPSLAQQKATIAVISIDSRGMTIDQTGMANLVRIELEKLNYFEVLDQYETAMVLDNNKIDMKNSFAKSELVRIGKMLKTDKMMSGTIEKFGNKIILSLRMVNVNEDKIDKAVVLEFIDKEEEINSMVRIGINQLLDLPNDQVLVDILSHVGTPVINEMKVVELDGTRMGAAYTFGKSGQRLMDSKANGGYNLYPVSTVFGYQYESQYLTAGDFAALIEVVGTISGLEAGTVMPSLTFMNGFRFNNSGFEFGLGPVFRLTKVAQGYFDSNDNWHMSSVANPTYPLEYAIDNRGSYKLSTGLILAVGKTFRSGSLNVPVNLYISPRKDGTVLGLTFGFNIAKRTLQED